MALETETQDSVRVVGFTATSLWQLEKLQPRERAIVAMALYYDSCGTKAGLPGHALLILIVKLVRYINKLTTEK